MEVEHAKPVGRHENVNQSTNYKRGDWHKRLRLRKSAPSSLSGNNVTEDVKVTPEGNKKPSLNENEHEHAVDPSHCKLTFTCSDCSDSILFSPSGLLNHFKVFHEGKGNPPSFPCDMCRFASPDFSALQQHRMKHKNCRLPCEICNDNVFHTPSQLTKHCKTEHTLNGQYHCGKCRFSTEKLNVFMHHPCLHSIAHPLNGEEKLDIKPMNLDLNRNHLTAVADADQKDALLKHKVCRRSWSRKNWWKKREVPQKQSNSNSPDFKLLLPKQETQWTPSGLLPFSAAGLLDANGILLHPAKTLEDTQQFLERSVNLRKNWPMTLKSEPKIASLSSAGPQPKTKECSMVHRPEKNKLSGLMEKNNISVPPDCTTKVVGFKMVDGKKHLILKVIPSSAKSDVSPETEQYPGINLGESDNIEALSLTERPGDTASKNGSLGYYDATSGLEEADKQGVRKKQHGKSTNVPQVHNTEKDCKGDCCEFVNVAGAAEHLDFSRTDGSFNVANRGRSKKQPTSRDKMSNRTYNLNGDGAHVSEAVRSARQTDCSGSQDAECKNKHPSSQEAAKKDSTERFCELISNYNDSGFQSRPASSISSYSGSLEDRFNSQFSALLSEKDRTIKNCLSNLNDGKMTKMQPRVVNYFTNQEKESTFEINCISQTLVSPYKHAKNTETFFNSPSEDGDVLFQDSSNDYTNNTGPGDALVPLDQSSTTATTPSDFAVSLLEDSCHNPDLFQTLEELPFTTVNHLLDDPDITCRGVTNQSAQLDKLSTQMPLQPCKMSTKVFAQSKMNESGLNRKRERNANNSEEPVSKSRRQIAQNDSENPSLASVHYWEPVPQDKERTLRLLPFCSSQPVKVPRLNQPVIVLNHPDTDIPEVSNIMRLVHRHKGAVQRVVLSKGTLKALSELKRDDISNSPALSTHSTVTRKVWPKGTVKERFMLKLKLKRVCRSRFKVVSASKTNVFQPVFRCWFCGRLFRNQELWVGHGQRHLMEATRDWNKLFDNEGQNNNPVQPYCHRASVVTL